MISPAEVDLGEIQFEPLPNAVNLRGTMSDANGQLVTGVKVYTLMHEDLPIQVALGVDNGRFELRVFPGRYRIVSRPQDGGAIATVEVKPNEVSTVSLQDQN